MRQINKTNPPPVMTMAKALPVIILALVFDAIRFFFNQFWFFAPAVSAIYCSSKASTYIGDTAAATLCTLASGAVGYFSAPAIIAFGVVMAIAFGLLGWMTIGTIIIVTNSRLFKENAGSSLWMAGGLFISEIPLIGSLPALTGTTIKLYRSQIKNDKKKLKEYQKQQEQMQTIERQNTELELMQSYNAQLAQEAV